MLQRTLTSSSLNWKGGFSNRIPKFPDFPAKNGQMKQSRPRELSNFKLLIITISFNYRFGKDVDIVEGDITHKVNLIDSGGNGEDFYRLRPIYYPQVSIATCLKRLKLGEHS